MSLAITLVVHCELCDEHILLRGTGTQCDIPDDIELPPDGVAIAMNISRAPLNGHRGPFHPHMPPHLEGDL